MILEAFKRRSRTAPGAAEAIYARIVAQARSPELYRDLGVPDTVMGRFEMIVLHTFLYLHRLKAADAAARARGQAVFDAMFADLDASLREIGVGDLSVPKKIKAMAQSFYGRTDVYDRALDAGDEEALQRALARNVYGDEASRTSAVAGLAAYVKAAAAQLAVQPTPALVAEGPAFPSARETAR